MIRYVVTFPGPINQDMAAEVRGALRDAGSRRVRDLVLSHGGTVVRLDTRRSPSVAVCNAQKRLR